MTATLIAISADAEDRNLGAGDPNPGAKDDAAFLWGRDGRTW